MKHENDNHQPKAPDEMRKTTESSARSSLYDFGALAYESERFVYIETNSEHYPSSTLSASIKSRYHGVLNDPFDGSDERQLFARTSPRRYEIPEYKRHQSESSQRGWQQLSDVARGSQHQLGSLFRRIDRIARIESIVLERLNVPTGDKVRAVLDNKQCLVLMVRSATLAHRLRFSLYAVKAEIEQALGVTIPKLEIKVKPDLI